NYTGTFAGDLYGSIENCHTESTVTVTGYRYVGGIAGDIESGGQISGCSNNADVLASDTNAGGITGRIDTGSLAVSESCNTGDVSGKSSVGGITGNQYAYQSVVNNTYNTGNVTASDGYAGGISGNFRSGTLKNSYSAGKVSAADSGIITGRLEWTTGAKALENVYYIDSQGIDAVGNLNGCTVQSGEAVPKTSDELKGIASELGEAFEQDSSGINSGYPVLAWQNGTDISQDPEKDENGWQGEISDTAPNQENGIYQISTPAELKWFAEKSRKESSRNIKAVLTDDIDLNYNQWVCIGGTDEAAAFEGTFDGAGYTIKNLYIKNSKGSGLVGYNGGTIKNVKITGIIKNSDNAGAAAGYNAGEISEVTSCVSVSEGSYIAGIAGSNIGGVIEECHNKSMISGNGYVGGIAGYNKGTIKKCTNTAVIRSSSTFSAGIAADNDEGTVEECANSGHIINTAAVRLNFIGGIIGRNAGNAENLYNTGNIVSRGSSVGGCVGINTSGSSANNLFSLGDVSGASVDNDGVKEFRVGGAIGEVTSGVSNAYYLETIAIAESGSKGGIKANAGTIK
ncbi:MAG: GLUG motif-containing protein, partial [Anaerovoracaceae bacterium]